VQQAHALPAVVELSNLNGANGFALNGIGAVDFSGYSVSSAGDVNGDLIVGARSADPNGAALAAFGLVRRRRNRRSRILQEALSSISRHSCRIKNRTSSIRIETFDCTTPHPGR